MKQSGEDIGEGGHSVIYIPLYSIRWIAVLSKLEHGQLSLQDVSHFVELLSVWTYLGAHETLI